MTVPAASLRRGACPGLTAPMPTGDGLLVRLTPSGTTMPLNAVAALSAAARQHGNGILEVTARGNIQVRGLSDRSASAFAGEIAAVRIAAPDGVPILVDPLAGLAAETGIHAGAVAAALRRRLASESFVATLGPKVSVAIDSGAALHLDAVPADIRLRAGSSTFNVAVGGTAESAVSIGTINERNAVDVATRLLEAIARGGPNARARDLVRDDGRKRLRDVLAGLANEPQTLKPRPPAEPIGLHSLRGGQLALGIALAYGHTDADTLQRLIAAARRAGAAGLRTAPGRALLVIGIAPDVSEVLAAEAERLGFITRPDDPRRRVVACAGAPICASGHIPARALAPAISAAVAMMRDGAATVHVSGCRKGCAHLGKAALTIVGHERGCDLIANGGTHGRPFAVVPTPTLLTEITRVAGDTALLREPAHG